MIVYNVKRRWFPMKSDAERYRVAEGLPPSATFKLEISTREELAALLNGLCEPPVDRTPADFPAPAKIIDEAFVDPDFEVPAFLRKDYE